MYLDKEDLQNIRKAIADDLEPKIRAIVERRMDGMQEQLNKLRRLIV